jgi:drug/metabolite transporter (DMT)-like permease
VIAPWIWVTLVAATAQTARFMLQKHLRGTGLSTAGATFARFLYSAPLVALIAWFYAGGTGQGMPVVAPSFWAFAMFGGVAQIAATMCVVAIFAHRNFAVGITFKKTEVIQSALLGFLVLGEAVSGGAMIAILIGLVGVVLLSDPPAGQGAWHRRIFNPAAGLGLASGALFAVSAVGYRGATLAIAEGDAFYRALCTLAFVTAFQTVTMTGYLVWRQRGELGRVLRGWRVAGLVGVTSMIGSIGWFTAFALQTVALVKAVGQVELVLSLLASMLVFGERISRREWQGLALLAVSLVLLVLIA